MYWKCLKNYISQVGRLKAEDCQEKLFTIEKLKMLQLYYTFSLQPKHLSNYSPAFL